MQHRLRLLPGLGLLLIGGLAAIGQVRDPQLPRSWWPAAKRYIDAQAAAKMLALAWKGTPKDTVLAVFTPVDSVRIQRVDVFATTRVDSDTTALVIANGYQRLTLPLDSAGGRKIWSSTAGVTFRAGVPCTLRFSDDAFGNGFVSGAANPAIVIQYRVAPTN